MSKVRIVAPDRMRAIATGLSGEVAGGHVSTREILGGAADPIHARFHDMAAGSSLDQPGGGEGCLVYVWQGVTRVDGADLEAGSTVVVEHGARTRFDAPAEATLLVFNRAAGGAAPERAGGHVHILPADRVPRIGRLNDRANVGAAILADSDCPTCELWLHESSFHDPDSEVAPHSHSEDEVIVVTKGSIRLGQRLYGPGTALAVAKDVIYGFHTGPEGLWFINFRPCHPTYVTADGSRTIDEQALYRDALGRPPYLVSAA